MKKLLTITALLFSLTSFGQRWNHNDGKKTMLDQWNDERGSTKQIWLGINQIAVIKSSGNDTLKILTQEIVDNNHLFKYIKVGDKIFQEVEPVKKWYAHPNSWEQKSYFPMYPISGGFAQVVPAIALKTDTTSFITTKRICGHVIDSLILNSDTIPFKPSKNKTSDRKKIVYESYDILGFIGASDTASMPMGSFLTVDGKNKYYSYINKLILQDRANYQIELMKRYKLSAEKAAKEAERRFSLIK